MAKNSEKEFRHFQVFFRFLGHITNILEFRYILAKSNEPNFYEIPVQVWNFILWDIFHTIFRLNFRQILFQLCK